MDFKLVITTPTFREWGQFTDAYGDSPLEDLDDEFDKIADCNDSAMWEGEEIK
jgi:hypothetical protein